MTWRYIARRATTGDFLDYDVPFIGDALPTFKLSAVGSMSGTVTPDTGALRASDGDLLLQEWGTLLYAESVDDETGVGEIKWGGIVTTTTYNGPDWTIEVANISTFPHGLPFLDNYIGEVVDPADVVRMIWAHLQGFRSSALGVTVVGSTKQTVGTRSTSIANAALKDYTAATKAYELKRDELAQRRAATTAARKVYSARVATRTAANAELTAANKTKPKDTGRIARATAAVAAAKVDAAAQEAAVKAKDALADAYAPQVAASKKAKDAAYALKVKTAQAARDDGGAYLLQWWEAPDCGDAIDSLADETPFDWTERSYWDGDDIKTEIRIWYPRAGRRRNDLAFVMGENITEVVQAGTNGDTYVNGVIGIGAGEGKGSLRRSTAIDDGRLRRVLVHTAKDVKKAATLDARIRKQLDAHVKTLTVDSITVQDHEHARIGSWALGDDILVDFDVPWLGRQQIWHRITAWSPVNDDKATLTLARSDSFIYGG